ncbi:MAG TPA: glutathione S-transferase family protein [Geminicoccaceae bacterium]|nr:glutathione S-transferase family protein [Geminicoccus sp.]HMU48761.1 glutathione S-transferase family protein [Geminicoccaceae bacterium]
MITLHQFAPSFGLINVSPFCVKLESWLRLTGLAYRVQVVFDPSVSPKGKAPFIEDEDGRRIADSAFIIEHLRQSRGVDPDDWLTPAQRGIGRAIGTMLEDRLYFASLYNRWIAPGNWPTVRSRMLGSLPDDVADAIREHQHARILGHGIGSHAPEEIGAIAAADIAALSDILGDQPFLFGDRPASADCTAFGFVHGLLCEAFDGADRRAIQGRPNLLSYERRMRERLFPETLDSARA